MADLTLPHENPEWIYEGLDPSLYEKATGRVLNRAPKQIQTNVAYLIRELAKVSKTVAGFNNSGDGSIYDNRTDIMVLENDIFNGHRLKLPKGMKVDERIHEIVITDIDTKKHYYKPEHFTIIDPDTLLIKTTIRRGSKLLFRIWFKRNKLARQSVASLVLAGTAIQIPVELDYIPTVHNLVVQVDGVTQKEYVVGDGVITFKFDVNSGQEIIFLSV